MKYGKNQGKRKRAGLKRDEDLEKKEEESGRVCFPKGEVSSQEQAYSDPKLA